MPVITPLTWEENIGKDKVVVAYSDAPNNLQAIFEVDDWARAHGYVRSRESTLNIKQDAQGHRYFYCACYLLDEDDRRAADADLLRIRERRERMPLTTPSDVLLRQED